MTIVSPNIAPTEGPSTAPNERPIRVTLCADDFGLSPAVSRGIASLLERGRLSATGAMTITPFWSESAPLLEPFADRIDIGLHWTLTDQTPLGNMPKLAPDGCFPTLGKLLKGAMLGRLPLDEIEAELHRQLDAFETVWGEHPDFIDGHHHIQQLPGIRDVLIRVVMQRYGTRNSTNGTPRTTSGANPQSSMPWIRSCWMSPETMLRRGVDVRRCLAIGLPGRTLAKLAQEVGLTCNRGFGGIYDFSEKMAYGEVMARTLAYANDGMVIMCHPGEVDDALRKADSLTEGRLRELAYLAGDWFEADLNRYGVKLGRLVR
ncbi:MAG: ChbG/HpnK family deacetylase [Magnetococcales bacterium]|nr:ChbG/HpnK family deacetylase [Magnetococcales bacterium]